MKLISGNFQWNNISTENRDNINFYLLKSGRYKKAKAALYAYT